MRHVFMNQSKLTQELLSKIRVSEHTIIEFFAVFSRFEYSLKCAGYFDKNKHYVAADWDDFANELNSPFEKKLKQNYQLKSAVDYLTTNPPKKQINSDGGLSWSKTSPWDGKEPILKWLLTAVRRIRNNLFHGGKFRGGPVEDPTRDQRLLECSLCILEECLLLDAAPALKVKGYFESKLG